MNELKILEEKEKQEIVSQLKDQFGIKDIPGTILMRGQERLFLFQGNLERHEIRKLERRSNVERVGIYFAKIVQGEDSIKLSIEGTQILGSQITKNIFSLDSSQAELWMKGQDLDLATGKRGFLVIKHKDDFLGCGKASEKKIGNFIPKARRLRERSS